MKSLKIFVSILTMVGSISATSRADLVIGYTDGSPVTAWPLPDPQGVKSMGMRFTNPAATACTLKAVSVLLLNLPKTGRAHV